MLRSSTEEDPEYRSDEYTPDMISQITKWRLAYEKLPELSAIRFSTEYFARVMAVDYVQIRTLEKWWALKAGKKHMMLSENSTMVVCQV